MITLHQYHLSPFNDKIQRMLNFKGITFEEKYWSLLEGKKVKQFNPTGKLPALEHQGNWVCDSTEMAYYIEENFPEPALLPAEPKLRAQVHVLEDWADESLYYYEMHLRFTTPGNAERNMPRMVANENGFIRWLFPKIVPRGIRRITATQGVGRKSQEQLMIDTERHVRAVSDMLDGDEWLVGNRLTLGDLAVHCMFNCLRDVNEVKPILEKYPAVPAWMDRLETTTDQRATAE